ncbi:hypothetical protein ACSSVV_001797 [Marinobacter sp. MBR-105]|jgi:hypothetical protein
MDAETGKDSDNPILTGPFWPWRCFCVFVRQN